MGVTNPSRALRLSRAGRIGALLLSLLVAACASQNYGDELFTLRRATHGKDVMWIPTKVEMAQAMLEAAKVGPSDIVYDLGSGDGVIPIQAAKQFGVRAVGIEYNPDLVALSKRNAARAGVEQLVQFRHGDIFVENFHDATVLTLYLGESLNARLMPRILKMRPGTRVVSNTFRMDAWTPDDQIRLPSGEFAFIWIVPAPIDGTWHLDGGGEFDQSKLVLRQKNQFFEGYIETSDRKRISIEDGEIRGDAVTFLATTPKKVRQKFVGAFSGGQLIGEFFGTTNAKLVARRVDSQPKSDR